MINLIDLIYIERNLLSADECDTIINENVNSKTYRENSLNNNLIHDYSGGIVCDVNPYEKSIDILNKKTFSIIEQYYFYLKDFDYFIPEILIDSFKYSHNYRFLTYNGTRYCVNSFLCPKMLPHANRFYTENMKIEEKYKHEFKFNYDNKCY